MAFMSRHIPAKERKKERKEELRLVKI